MSHERLDTAMYSHVCCLYPKRRDDGLQEATNIVSRGSTHASSGSQSSLRLPPSESLTRRSNTLYGVPGYVRTSNQAILPVCCYPRASDDVDDRMHRCLVGVVLRPVSCCWQHPSSPICSTASPARAETHPGRVQHSLLATPPSSPSETAVLVRSTSRSFQHHVVAQSLQP